MREDSRKKGTGIREQGSGISGNKRSGLLSRSENEQRPRSPIPDPRSPPRRIIGIDPGLASTGWGIVDCKGGKIRHAGHGSIETKAGTPHAERLFQIMEAVRSLLVTYKPTEAAVELLYFGRNVSSAIPVAESRGVVFAVLADYGITVQELRPNAIKQGVTGVANAGKKQVQEMVRIILGLPDAPTPDHAADALAAAICTANRAVSAP